MHIIALCIFHKIQSRKVQQAAQLFMKTEPLRMCNNVFTRGSDLSLHISACLEDCKWKNQTISK